MIIGLIPARLNSIRLKNKPLKLLDGIPIIMHVLKRASMSKKLEKIIVCADDEKIVKLVRNSGYEACMTSKKYNNGTERISSYLNSNYNEFKKIKLIVDIQCDEVFLNPNCLDHAIKFHFKNLNKFDLVVPHSITKQKNNKNFVKIISDNSGRVLYFTRSDAPYNFRTRFSGFKRHLDFITFTPKFLKIFNLLKNRNLENYEGIELMRALENNYRIGTLKIKKDIFSINTQQDFNKAKKIMKKDKLRKCY